jgi:hypothetical protein
MLHFDFSFGRDAREDGKKEMCLQAFDARRRSTEQTAILHA